MYEVEKVVGAQNRETKVGKSKTFADKLTFSKG